MMRVLRVLCLALVVGAAAKKKRAKKRSPAAAAPSGAGALEENEYTRTCSECYKMAQHASRALKFNIENSERPSRDAWKNVLKAGCGFEEQNLCNRVLLPKFGGALSDEVWEIYDAADGDPTDSATEFSALADALCGANGITQACPPGFHVHPKPPKVEPGSWEANETAYEDKVVVSFWNNANMGEIELHLVDLNKYGQLECVDSEQPDSPHRNLVRVVKAGEDKLVTLFKTLPEAPGDVGAESKPGITYTIDDYRPAVRVKPRHAPCGDGYDVEIDFAKDKYAVYEVRGNPAFNGYQPRNATNVPLTAERMGASEKVGKAAAATEILLPADAAAAPEGEL